ncbi:MAG: hypothetical protein PUE83_04390 [Lachnobacterium sp.]|nr:hypothetical protein [Lachnobacterium sp.]
MKKILVVDDDAMNLKMACFILDKKSYPVITAMSGGGMHGLFRT